MWQGAYPGRPAPGVPHSPVAHGVHNGAAGLVQCMAHGCVAVNDPVTGGRPAIVILQEIDAPVCKGFGIHFLMVPAPYSSMQDSSDCCCLLPDLPAERGEHLNDMPANTAINDTLRYRCQVARQHSGMRDP